MDAESSRRKVKLFDYSPLEECHHYMDTRGQVEKLLKMKARDILRAFNPYLSKASLRMNIESLEAETIKLSC